MIVTIRWKELRLGQWSSAIINFNAMNRHQLCRARCNQHEKLVPESGMEFMAPVSGVSFCRCVWGLTANVKLARLVWPWSCEQQWFECQLVSCHQTSPRLHRRLPTPQHERSVSLRHVAQSQTTQDTQSSIYSHTSSFTICLINK